MNMLPAPFAMVSRRSMALLLGILPMLSPVTALAAPAAAPPPVQFNRDIRPILSENCFYCHGQDPAHREADLRLDVRAAAIADLGGYAAIQPGKPDESEVIKRLTSHDADDVMPPPKSNRRVTPQQIELIRRWIAEGADYQKHWAFETPVKPPLPAVRRADWPREDFDRFVLAKLEAEGLQPAKEATPQKWLRRVSLDLIGLPPTPEQTDAFLQQFQAEGERAYAAAVDRLLASERFGERQAIEWLDAARYADTHGFNNDSARSMWRWRDWVIEAFNANKRYDQFITEQLSGDLLQNPTLDQRLATGFGRNHVINSEGGIIDEEYRVEYVADRVRTMSMAWLGLTFECSRCHDHKFDPVTQKDYYRLFAFFNNVPEMGEDGRVANAVPMISAPTRAQQHVLTAQAEKLHELKTTLEAARGRWRWDASMLPAVTRLAEAAAGAAPTKDRFLISMDAAEPKEKAWSFDSKPPLLSDGIRGRAWATAGSAAAAKLEAAAFPLNVKDGATVSFWIYTDADSADDVALFSNLDHSGNPADAQYGKGTELRWVRGELEFRAADRFPVYAMRVRTDGAGLDQQGWRHVAVVFSPPDPQLMRTPASVLCLFIDGVEQRTVVLNDGLAGGVPSRPWLLGADNKKGAAGFKGRIDEWRAYPRPLTATEIRATFQADALPAALAAIRNNSADPRMIDWVRDALLPESDPALATLQERYDRLREAHFALLRDAPTAMVMAEMPQPRPAAVLNRGAYDAPGEKVTPGVPEALLAPWPADAPPNRLGLARWLTRPDHPLVGRVVVNRYWAQLFGVGIVKTLEDFGYQAEWPSHPELLDHLARAFVDGGWDMKAFLRSIVLSATYRQDSAAPPELYQRDPENRLLARGPRVRLPAEVLRDQALAVSGLLKHRLGGPSVYPYQPEDLYKGVVVGAKYPGTTWPTAQGDDLYRRSLYTFWKRTVPHPVMTTLDAPDREFCSVRRSRTNTPLQALVLMNEPGVVEASRELAGRMLREGGGSTASRVVLGFRLTTGRVPTEREQALLVKTWERFDRDFKADSEAAASLIDVGASKADAALPSSDLAAATLVANLLLNLDETLTKD